MPTTQRNAQLWLVAVGGVLVLALVTLTVLGVGRPDDETASIPVPTIFAGEPGGEVFAEETSTPTATVEATPSVTPTVSASPVPPAPTPVPVAISAPTPAPPPPPPATPAPTPVPTAVIVAAVQPNDAVAAFYGHVADGNFDAAYSLWSDRMKATYPREGNLDGRFAETASITFHQLYVAEQRGRRASVQANFTETYDSGATREFIGFWRLVRVEGRWLLDEPHY